MLERRRTLSKNEARPEDQYLTFVALENCQFTLTIGRYVTNSDVSSVSYSLDDGKTWTTTNHQSGSTDTVITTPSVSAGETVLWKGSATKYANAGTVYNSSVFSSTGNYYVEGNIMSLLYGANFKNQKSLSGKKMAFLRLFFESGSKLKDVSNLILPATTLSESCYQDMFYACTSIETTPVLPATYLYKKCYSGMFYICDNLTSVTCLATNISASQCTNSWLTNVGYPGTFTKPASMTSWGRGADGIPVGWNVVDI